MSGRHRWDGPLHAVPREILRVVIHTSAAGAVVVTSLAFGAAPATSPPVPVADRPPILGMPLTILPDPTPRISPPAVKPIPGVMPRGHAARAVKVAHRAAAHPGYAVPVSYTGRHRAPVTVPAARAAAPAALPPPSRQPAPAPKPAPKPLPVPAPKPPPAVDPPAEPPPPEAIAPPEASPPPPDHGGGCGH